MLAASGALALTAMVGCAAAPLPPPTPSSTAAAPVFASEEEALAAATEAYAAYLSMSDQILIDGGENPERIKPFASAAMAETEMKGYANAKSKGYRSTGASRFDNLTLQSIDAAATEGAVSAYLCSDVSEVDVVDASGDSVVSPDRPSRTPFQVVFDVAATAPPQLVVASADVWNGSGVC